MCAGRESNSDLVRGRDVYYHCTTGADVVVCQWALHSACPSPWGHKRCGAGAQTGRGQEAMAQWQRVGFQTQRLGVRIPLASYSFFGPFFFAIDNQNKKKKCTAETGNRTQAAAATTRSPATRLFRRNCIWRIRVSIPVLNLAKVVCYHVQQSPMCVHRDSNPNLILGRDKYYPCTMDARIV